MSLQFHLIPNHINPNSNNYIAVSTNTKSYTLEDIFDRMTRQGSTLTKAEALAAFEEITQSMIEVIQEGASITTPLLNVGSSVNGTFKDEEDSFDTGRHQISINVSAGVRLRKAATDIDPEKVTSKKRIPKLTHYFDVNSDTSNEFITPGGGARITGSLLKFDEEDTGQGVFFVNEQTMKETKVEASMLKNKPSELIFLTPELPAGTYRVEVRSIIYNTKKMRSGHLSDPLVVKEN